MLNDWRNKLLPGNLLVSYALKSFNELPFQMAITYRYKKIVNTMVFGTLSKHLHVLSVMFKHTN